jgi:predicted AlkP superfamily phosphohydrolase/phosphomutase
MKKNPNVTIIGLDAATCTLLPRSIADDGMPILAKLLNAGVSGRLEQLQSPRSLPQFRNLSAP